MVSRKINLLMRLFFRYNCQLVLVLEKQQLVLVEKNDINILMSDLTNFRNATKLPSKEIHSLEQLLQVYGQSGMLLNQKPVIALVNENIDLIAQLGKEEVIRLWDQLQELKKTQQSERFKHESQTEEQNIPIEQNKTENESFASYWQRRKKEQTSDAQVKKSHSRHQDSIQNIQRENIRKSSEKNKEESKEQTKETNQQENKKKKEEDDSTIVFQKPQQSRPLPKSVAFSSPRPNIKTEPPEKFLDQGRLAIITMEALPLPMLACDTLGNELFFNHDWDFFYRQKKEILNKHVLLEEAKAIMVKKAKEGSLNAQTPLWIEKFSAYNAVEKRFIGYDVFLKAIRLDTDEGQEKTIGYLFYILPQLNAKQEVHDTKDQQSYLGRTLPEIVAEEEKKALRWAYLQAGENQSNAAMLLGIPRQTYSYKFNKYFKKRKT